MAQPKPGFKANAGTPEQLPKGAAQALNEGTNVQAPAEPQVAAPTAMPEQATPADHQPNFQPQSEDEQFLVSLTTRPNEPLATGADPRPTLPPDFGAWFPTFQLAARSPGAGVSIRLLVQALQEMNR